MRKERELTGEYGKNTDGQSEKKAGHAASALPASTAERLPRYFRCLKQLLVDGAVRTSSAQLAGMLRLTAAQVRADLRYFGNAGQQGYGYYVKTLYTEISRTLGAGDGLCAVMICADEVGTRMADGSLFAGRGVTLTARFTAEQGFLKECTAECAVPLYPLAELERILTAHPADIAVIGSRCVDVRRLAERLAACGVRGIWNLSEEELKSFPGVQVRNLAIGDSLMLLCYEIRHGGRALKP